MKKRFFWIYLTLAACILAAAVLSGCAAKGERLLWYQDGQINVGLRGNVNGVEIAAELILFEAEEGKERAFELRISAPKTLEGVVFCRDGEGILKAEIGGVEVELPKSDGIGATVIADLFDLSGDPVRISTVKGAEADLEQYGELTRLEFPTATVLVDPATSLPVRIISARADIKIVSFDMIETSSNDDG